MQQTPCFLVGAERSGTTLLRLALNAHSGLAWTREFEYAVDQIGADGSFPSVEEYCDWLDTHRIFRSSAYAIRQDLAYPDLIRDFLEQQRSREAKPFVGATVHRHFDRLLRIWPDARFIHLVRDPRDVARSVVKMGWAGNTWVGVEAWIFAEQLWEQMKGEVPEERRCEVQYEDFAARPDVVLRRVCSFLGLSYESRMLEFHRHSSYRPPDPSMIEQWRYHATAQEIAWVEVQAASQMRAVGYKLSAAPRHGPARLRRWALGIHDYWSRVNFRIRRNGYLLSLVDWASRRLRMDALQRSIRLRINAIESQHLQ